ncbi:uncharacterized protein LOC130548405 isoform X4 [Triplophysa rosa]|uniref:uncharacterized protein LOC130548405 isoform X4 n=1 Tax=Triplophysa rosa TaxID=992332 RepID=UPI002545DEAF|nr:uncharacterized protein LOC130548405 isoform X4 [Triplophysa rosa]
MLNILEGFASELFKYIKKCLIFLHFQTAQKSSIEEGKQTFLMDILKKRQALKTSIQALPVTTGSNTSPASIPDLPGPTGSNTSPASIPDLPVTSENSSAVVTYQNTEEILENQEVDIGEGVAIHSEKWKKIQANLKDSLFVKELAVCIWGTSTCQP